MLPNSESSGSDGVCTSVVPIFAAAGQAIGLFVPLPNSASVQATSVFAAAGLMLVPSGRTTLAFFRYELAIGSFGSNGIRTSTVEDSGVSTNSPAGPAVTDGLNGTRSQPDAPTEVVNAFWTKTPGAACWSICTVEVWPTPVQLLGIVR